MHQKGGKNYKVSSSSDDLQPGDNHGDVLLSAILPPAPASQSNFIPLSLPSRILRLFPRIFQHLVTRKKENSSGEKTIRQHVNLFSPPSATLQFNFMPATVFARRETISVIEKKYQTLFVPNKNKWDKFREKICT